MTQKTYAVLYAITMGLVSLMVVAVFTCLAIVVRNNIRTQEQCTELGGRLVPANCQVKDFIVCDHDEPCYTANKTICDEVCAGVVEEVP